MKRIYLGILFLLFAKSIFSQTIEVIITDSIMCKVENYEYLLTVNIPCYASVSEKRKLLKKRKFEDNLNSKNYVYEDFYEKNTIQVSETYMTVEYRIIFESLNQKNDFENKMNLENHLFVIQLIEFRIKYEEKEKARLLEKMILKGKEKAKLIAKGLGKKLGEINHISEAVDPQLMGIPSENIVIGNYGVRRKKEPNIKNEAEKIKSLRITFNTK